MVDFFYRRGGYGEMFFTGAVAMVRFFIFSVGWNFDWWNFRLVEF